MPGDTLKVGVAVLLGALAAGVVPCDIGRLLVSGAVQQPMQLAQPPLALLLHTFHLRVDALPTLLLLHVVLGRLHLRKLHVLQGGGHARGQLLAAEGQVKALGHKHRRKRLLAGHAAGTQGRRAVGILVGLPKPLLVAASAGAVVALGAVDLLPALSCVLQTAYPARGVGHGEDCRGCQRTEK